MAVRIEKQVEMLESLLEDKKSMQAQIEQLTKQLEDTQVSTEKQSKVLEERLGVELKKNRDAWVASEKIRKEKWEKEKVNEIRAQTVKGLEPEIQRIIEKNKDDMRRLDESHNQKIREMKEAMLVEHDNKVQ